MILTTEAEIEIWMHAPAEEALRLLARRVAGHGNAPAAKGELRSGNHPASLTLNAGNQIGEQGVAKRSRHTCTWNQLQSRCSSTPVVDHLGSTRKVRPLSRLFSFLQRQ